MTTKQIPTDIDVTVHNLNGITSIGCNFKGAQFHIWTDFELRTGGDEIVFKNPQRDSTGEAYYRTRRLSSLKGEGKVVFDALMTAAPAMLPDAIQAKRNAEALDAAQRAEEYTKKVARGAGVELLSALARLVAAQDAYGSAAAGPARSIGAEVQELGAALRDARAAIGLATPQPSCLATTQESP